MNVFVSQLVFSMARKWPRYAANSALPVKPDISYLIDIRTRDCPGWKTGHSSVQHPVGPPESDVFRSVLTPPAFIRQQAAWQPVLGLPWRVAIVDLKSRVYTNQSEPGEARTAGSNSAGGGNAPFFVR